MSSLVCSKYEEDAGCCNSPTVLQIRKKPVLSIFTHFSEDGIRDFDDLHDRFSLRTPLAGEGEVSTYLQYKAKFCKTIPVKVTTSARHNKSYDGKKMINQYVKERKISCGSYGKVVLYRNSENGTPYAIKVMCRSRLRKMRVRQSRTAMDNALREVSILKMLEHPNIVNLVEVIDDPGSDYLYMVLEYIEGGSINKISEMNGRLDEFTARNYLKDIIYGLSYLHQLNIVHGDIKPDNLLVTQNRRVKIGDFSLSHFVQDENDELWSCPGTPAFTAPELCSDSFYDGKVADTWAVGVTLYYMVTGCYPFIGDSLPDTYQKIIDSPLLLPECLDPDLKDLLQSLLCKDPLQRNNLESVAKHPWMLKEGTGPVPTGTV